MNELELRLRVQNTIESAVNSLAEQGVSFTMLEDALYKTLVNIKDKAYQEFIISVSIPAQEEQPREEEEVDGGAKENS